MKEHGILFSSPMVRALLAGTKTQTRRIVKGQKAVPGGTAFQIDRRAAPMYWVANDAAVHEDWLSMLMSPHGPVGRILWVRETWAPAFGFEPSSATGIMYAADRGYRTKPDAVERCKKGPFFNANLFLQGDEMGLKWRPSLLMPRWASRITLEVTGVRLERVHAISPEDVDAEGMTRATVEEFTGAAPPVKANRLDLWRLAWVTINGAESWASNPWVWAYDFRRTA